MTIDERLRIIKILEGRNGLSPRESQLRKILVRDENMVRIDKCLEDNPDIRGLAYDLLEIL